MGANASSAFAGNDELIAFMEQINKQFVIGGAFVFHGSPDLPPCFGHTFKLGVGFIRRRKHGVFHHICGDQTLFRIFLDGAVPVYALLTGATMADTAAQWGLNAALYSCPIVWIIILIIARVALHGSPNLRPCFGHGFKFGIGFICRRKHGIFHHFSGDQAFFCILFDGTFRNPHILFNGSWPKQVLSCWI